MKRQGLLWVMCVGVLSAGLLSACGEPKPEAKVQLASENVSTPGSSGGSCSATSDDKKQACSISCDTGKAAYCSNTATTATCECGP